MLVRGSSFQQERESMDETESQIRCGVSAWKTQTCAVKGKGGFEERTVVWGTAEDSKEYEATLK